VLLAGAPMRITEDLITTFNISLVVRGTVTETAHSHDLDEDRYAVPQAKGIFK
jgi:ethanolamine-phosphate cytidylyltransferase